MYSALFRATNRSGTDILQWARDLTAFSRATSAEPASVSVWIHIVSRNFATRKAWFVLRIWELRNDLNLARRIQKGGWLAQT
jgi:hypothetical protein